MPRPRPLTREKGSGDLGHMEKQETEIKRKLEMETGNGNRKLKTEMETKDAPITGAIFSS